MPRKPTRPRDLHLTRPNLAFAVLSAVWILLLYAPALWSPFVYDDLDGIVHNANLATAAGVFHRFVLAPVSFTSEFRATSGATWRPLFWSSLALDRRLFGLDPSGFHATNLVLHWLNGLLLFGLLRRTMRDANGNPAASLQTLALPTLTALLWLTLPTNSEAVAWISGRAYPLCLMFVLLSLHAGLSYLRSGRPVLLFGCAAAALLALLANESGLLLLPVALLLAYPLRSTNSAARPVLVLPAALLATDSLFLVVRRMLHASAGHGPPALWSVGLSFVRYLSWTLFPVHMSVERSTSTPANSPTPAALLASVALLVYFAAIVDLRRRNPAAAAGSFLFALGILPFCGFVPLYQGMAERFLYIPSIGLALAITALALGPPLPWKRATLAALVLFLVGCGLRLHARVDDWTDPATLYETSLAATPASPGLFFNLAFTARERGDLDTAREDYAKAIALEPRYQRAYASLGDVEARLQHPAEAARDFQQALRLNPEDAPTRNSLALTLETMGDGSAAEQEFRRSLRLAPSDPATYTDLGVLLSQQGRVDEAIQSFQHAIELAPNDPTAYFDLGILFQKRGQDDLALPFYRKVLDLKPDDPETLINVSHLHTQH